MDNYLVFHINENVHHIIVRMDFTVMKNKAMTLYLIVLMRFHLKSIDSIRSKQKLPE